MGFSVGDKVIHWPHGPGEIVRIETKPIHGQLINCYVVRTTDMTIWVPIDEAQQHSIRVATPASEFTQMLAILTNPPEKLPEDRAMRKDLLSERMRDGQMSSIFHVVRDLSSYKQSVKLNDVERSILERAINALLAEWTSSLGIARPQAQQALFELLGE